MKRIYNLLIIDDQMDIRIGNYKDFFCESQFNVSYISDYDEFNELNGINFDAIIIDVFLDQNQWTDSKSQQIKKDIKNRYDDVPIFIISSEWGQNDILSEMSLLTDVFGNSIVDYLSFNEIKSSIKSEAVIKKNQIVSRFIDKLRLFRQDATSLKLAENKELCILLLSDIQFQDPHTDKSSKGILGNIANQLGKDKVYPDLLIITGDIGYSGCPLEYETALNELEPFIKFLWGRIPEELRKQRIILVPGNHDVNLRLSASSSIKFSPNEEQIKVSGILKEADEGKVTSEHSIKCDDLNSSYRNYGLQPFRDFAFKLTGDQRWHDSKDLNWLDKRFEHLGLKIFNVNTVHELDVLAPKKATICMDNFHYYGDTDDSFNLLISHHGYHSQELDEESHEAIIGNFLKPLDINLWLWGHHHTYDSGNISEPLKSEDCCSSHYLQVPSTHQNSIKKGDRERGFVILTLWRENHKITSATSLYYKTLKDHLPKEGKTENLEW